jgi:hypothetical protein
MRTPARLRVLIRSGGWLLLTLSPAAETDGILASGSRYSRPHDGHPCPSHDREWMLYRVERPHPPEHMPEKRNLAS